MNLSRRTWYRLSARAWTGTAVGLGGEHTEIAMLETPGGVGRSSVIVMLAEELRNNW